MAVVASSSPSQAQLHDSFCYEEDSFFPGTFTVLYHECGDAADAVAAQGQSLAAVGEGFTQQQLNIASGFAGMFATPTGRLRHTDHDGLREKNTGVVTDDFEVDEASFYGNATYDLPGTYFGGHVRVAGLLGFDGLNQTPNVVGDITKTEIESFIYGGSYLWSKGSFYTMSLIIGLTGDADARNAAGKYSYDLDGYFSNSVMGNTFDLGTMKFDLRAGLGHYDLDGGNFTVPGTAQQLSGEASAWNGSLTGTLFTIMEMEGGVARPYVLASYKHVFDEEIEIKGAGNPIEFEQADDYGKIEFGFDFVKGATTFGAAGYGEFSEDESTIGGRMGVSVKLQ